VRQHLCIVVIARALAEGQRDPLRLDLRGGHGASDCSVSQLGVIHRVRGRAVNETPDFRLALLEVAVDGARIQDRDGIRDTILRLVVQTRLCDKQSVSFLLQVE
jgi:hypothetical protein